MTGNDENGGGMNQSIIESATREHVYTGFVDPRKCSTQKKNVFTETYDTFGRSSFSLNWSISRGRGQKIKQRSKDSHVLVRGQKIIDRPKPVLIRVRVTVSSPVPNQDMPRSKF